MKNILLIGAGNLGSRHLQGVAKLTEAVAVCVVEPSAEARVVAKNCWQEIPSAVHHRLTFANLDSLNAEFDFAIVATLSIDRLDIIKRLIELKVPHILCEKVAFQSVHLYQQALDMLANSSSEIYLNYIYRLSDPIRNIKQKIGNAKVDLTVCAGNVELGCNLIHHLDLAAYLNDEAELTKLTLNDVTISDNNRRHPQLKSFFGIAEAQYANGAKLRARLLHDSSIDCTLEISTGNQSYLINETQGKLVVNRHTSADFTAPRVSDTTTEVIKALQQERCVLPTLRETFTVNKLMLDCLNQRQCGADDASILCPIT